MKREVRAPLINPNDPASVISHWYVESGGQVKKGDPLCDLATTKISFTVESEADGYVKPMRAIRSRVAAGGVLALIFPTRSEALSAAGFSETGEGISAPTFSRKAREALDATGVPENAFHDQQTVSERDVRLTVDGRRGEFLSPAKMEEIKNLSRSFGRALRSSVTMRVFEPLAGGRSLGQAFELQALWAFCAAAQLKQMPKFLSWFDGADERPGHVDIGYGLDGGKGVMQFMARDSDSWTIEEWRLHLAEWSLATARGEVRAQDLGMGNFSLTDLSTAGIFQFEPLLVGAQSATLGIGGDLCAGTPQFTLTLSFDHRVHSGREAAEFLAGVKSLALRQSGV